LIKIIIFCLLSLVLAATAYCGQLSKIELTDGSVINGEIVSFVNGVYTINTTTFGEVKLEAKKVFKIESANPVMSGTLTNPAAQKDSSTSSLVSTYGQKLMENPENASIVTGLAGNAKLQAVANDPQIQNAAKAGDIQSLLENPKFMEIVNSPEMQEAIKKLKK